MLSSTRELLQTARNSGYAVGGFNIYNLEGATAVMQAAEELSSPVILQVLPTAVQIGGAPLIAMCLEMVRTSSIPAVVHLDHCSSSKLISFALEYGCTSVMADGSDLKFEDNIRFTQTIVADASGSNASVEAELGKLSGEEDGIKVAARKAKLTVPSQAADFVDKTGVDALAVCIGNTHGKYLKTPSLDFERLKAIADQVKVPLVLHGASGLPNEVIQKATEMGICKFNVNTEIRRAYLYTLSRCFEIGDKVELVDLMQRSIDAMKDQVKSKIQLFGSAGKVIY